MIIINSRFEYDYCIEKGFNPLVDWRNFKIEINLRTKIQYELFGSADLQQENNKFYHWCWENKPHICEETAQTLYNYSSVHISHIISKGADRRIALDPRNINLLIFKMHNKWEFGNTAVRKTMNIYQMNRYLIEILKLEYNLR